MTKLVYFEHGTSAIDALNREKQIKPWRRDKKVRLIESINAGWHDLGADLLPSHAS